MSVVFDLMAIIGVGLSWTLLLVALASLLGVVWDIARAMDRAAGRKAPWER